MGGGFLEPPIGPRNPPPIPISTLPTTPSASDSSPLMFRLKEVAVTEVGAPGIDGTPGMDASGVVTEMSVDGTGELALSSVPESVTGLPPTVPSKLVACPEMVSPPKSTCTFRSANASPAFVGSAASKSATFVTPLKVAVPVSSFEVGARPDVVDVMELNFASNSAGVLPPPPAPPPPPVPPPPAVPFELPRQAPRARQDIPRAPARIKLKYCMN